MNQKSGNGGNMMLQTDSALSKAEMMDQYLKSCGKNVGYTEVQHIVHSLFGIDLETKKVISNKSARAALEFYIHQSEQVSGADIRRTINELFGINLDAISSLEKARISLFSKGQWVIQKENDLFVVHTGLEDVDVKIYSTPYFIEKTGVSGVPEGLQQVLIGLGYSYDNENNYCYYTNPTGEAVPDAFKGQTMGAIMKTIQEAYHSL